MIDKKQPKGSVYFGKTYDNLRRFISYYTQKDLIVSLDPKTTLEVGVGNSTLTNYLRNMGYNIKTLDIDKGLNPDYVGSVTNLVNMFGKKSFDLVICFEILEHLPFEEFERTLIQIRKTTKKHAIISLPNAMMKFSFGFKIPLVKRKDFFFNIPSGINHTFDNGHYWEIGKIGFPPKRIRNIIKNYFKLKREFVNPLNPNHRFYILEK